MQAHAAVGSRRDPKAYTGYAQRARRRILSSDRAREWNGRPARPLRGKFLCAVFRLHPRRAADDAGHAGAGADIAQMRNSGQRGRAAGMHADADGKSGRVPLQNWTRRLEQGCRKTKYWRNFSVTSWPGRRKWRRHIWKEICCGSDSGRNVVHGLRIVEGSVFCGLNRAGLYGSSKSKPAGSIPEKRRGIHRMRRAEGRCGPDLR